MHSYRFALIWCTFASIASFCVGTPAPLDPGLVTKLLTALNSLKAALPSNGEVGKKDPSAGDDGGGDKKAGQPTSFHMDDRSPEIEVKTSDMGMDIKTKPASLQVLSTPVEPVHVHEVIDDHIIGAPPHFIAPPEVVHPIQPIYYGNRRHHTHPFLGHYHHGPYQPYFHYPSRYYYQSYYPSHHVLFHDGDTGDDDDDGDEDGDKKENIPARRKRKRVWGELRKRMRHKKSKKKSGKRDWI